MDHNEFPPNSHASKEKPKVEEKTKIVPVVTGEVIQRKKSLGKRFKEHFTGPDSVSVLDYMINDLAIPAAKEMFADVVTGGLERRLFGTETPRGRRRSMGAPNQYGNVNYNKPGSAASRVDLSHRARNNHDFGELVIPSRAEAEEVISMLFMLLEQYGTATVSDLYELTNRSAHFTDTKWGWTDLRGASASRVRGGGGYVLNLPPTQPVD